MHFEGMLNGLSVYVPLAPMSQTHVKLWPIQVPWSTSSCLHTPYSQGWSSNCIGHFLSKIGLGAGDAEHTLYLGSNVVFSTLDTGSTSSTSSGISGIGFRLFQASNKNVRPLEFELDGEEDGDVVVEEDVDVTELVVDNFKNGNVSVVDGGVVDSCSEDILQCTPNQPLKQSHLNLASSNIMHRPSSQNRPTSLHVSLLSVKIFPDCFIRSLLFTSLKSSISC